MNGSKSATERTATDDRIDENRMPAQIAPATRDADQVGEGGLPPGVTDDLRSPIDRGFKDPAPKAET